MDPCTLSHHYIRIHTYIYKASTTRALTHLSILKSTHRQVSKTENQNPQNSDNAARAGMQRLPDPGVVTIVYAFVTKLLNRFFKAGTSPSSSPPAAIIPNPKMWRPGFVFYSKTYFPWERLSPSLAILCHHHTIQISGYFVRNNYGPMNAHWGDFG
jgi:hypothetical protein